MKNSLMRLLIGHFRPASVTASDEAHAMSPPPPFEESGVPLSLHQAVKEVELLLAYASQQGLKIEESDIDAIAKARKAVLTAAADNQTLNPSVETRFWGAYQRVAESIKPVTIGSIKASSDAYGREVRTLRGKRKMSRASLAVRRYQIWSVAALSVLLVVQLYAGVGATILNDLRTVQRLSNEQRQEIDILKLGRQRLLQLIDENRGAPPSETERRQQQLTEITKKLSNAERERNFMVMDLKAKYVFLEYWPWGGLIEDEPTAGDAASTGVERPVDVEPPRGLRAPATANTDTLPADPPGRGLASSEPRSDIDLPQGANIPGDQSASAPPPAQANAGDAVGDDAASADDADQTIRDPATADTNAGESLQQLYEYAKDKPPPSAGSDPVRPPAPLSSGPTARPPTAEGGLLLNHMHEKMQPIVLGGTILLEALNIYFLPLVYGLLGACAYVLRTLSKEIQRYTYSPNSEIRLQLRLYLGALSGFAVAWFVNEQTAPSVSSSITPLALAFLAGYSVEVVFALMDNLVSAFSRRSEKTDSA